MKTLFLSSLILFCLIIAYNNRRHSKMVEKQQKEYWDRENAANSTRKKPLDNLAYITIPLETLPINTLPENPKVQEYVELLQNLASVKIVNLTGYTNTDLKLEYGTANITVLSEYDANYTLLVRTLQDWAELLYKAGFTDEAQSVLEFAVSTNTDISRSYYLLADIYDSTGNTSKKETLIASAEEIRSVMKQTIVRTLQGSGPYSDWLRSE